MPYIVSQKREQPNLGGFPAHVATVAAAGDLAATVPVEEQLLSIEDFYCLGEPIVTECLDGGAPCSIAIVDIDRLFRISESHGTECAEAVLAEFGINLMHMASHRNMNVAHLGFDQFALLLAGQDGAEATESFDKLRQELGARAICWKGEMISLTVSIGLADIHGPETFDNYLNAAEQFLFMAKMSGRNQVVSDHSFGEAH